MREQLNFYIDGKWVAPAKPRTHDVINPANEEPVRAHFARLRRRCGQGRRRRAQGVRDLVADRASTSARRVLDKIIAIYQRRLRRHGRDHFHRKWARRCRSRRARRRPPGLGYLMDARKQLDTFKFEEDQARLAHPARTDRRRRHDHAVELAA